MTTWKKRSIDCALLAIALWAVFWSACGAAVITKVLGASDFGQGATFGVVTVVIVPIVNWLGDRA